ncbi:MAG: Cytochrome c biogenesis protein CcsA [Acidobacteria bacterium ADurb.Bin051]|jgi:ABC-type transport system involved in cytochrome c biogenesis permease subunit|nr:MAG: Cytochrome c biogenesis protein CcsA [Acidobacteria bacterium ADurb.Bin051]
MKRSLQMLASLKLTVVLLLLLAFVLAWGTIVESLHGRERAALIYYAPWFFALQGLFALNLLAALVERWPRTRSRIGFAVTHAAMLVILAGALVTQLFKVEGQLPLWEGQSSRTIFTPTGSGQLELPFAVRLDDFQIDYYDGTSRPAMFRSLVTVLDGEERAGVIEMNRPLTHGGYNFFQSSYQLQGGREMSILSVARDPGQAIVFLGYLLLVGGMILVFATRLSQLRAARLRTATAQGAAGPAAVLLLALALGAAGATAAGAAEIPPAELVARVRALPVQHDGRTMPFDTQAREAVRTVTGRRAWPGIDPVAMTLGWYADPQGWSRQPVVKVGGRKVAAAIGLAGAPRWASFEAIVGAPGFATALDRAHQKQAAEARLTPVEQDLLELEGRLVELDAFLRGRALRAVPTRVAGEAWQPPAARDAAALATLEAEIRTAAPAHYPAATTIARELRYNATRPTRLAWLLLLPAAIAAALTLERDRWRLDRLAFAGLIGGFLALSWGIWQRWQIAGRIPASNMYESMLFLGWGVALLGVIALALRNRMLLLNAAGTSALAVMLLDLLPMDPFVHPMPPVLSGTPWLAIHVPIIMLGYATLAMVTVFAHLVVGLEIFAPHRQELSRRWSELLYLYTHVGSILLLAGILTGSIWAASSWGRYWGWDPKEVWSLVAFLAYMAILHARWDAQIRAFGVALAAIAAFWTILMTYLGVNYVLAAGLHSYGFGSSRLVGILVIVALVEILFAGSGWLAHRRRRAAAS